VTNRLHRAQSEEISRRVKRRRKGWSAERRALQAAVIRRSKPWQHATGPRTQSGKARCAMNALKHGRRSRATIRMFQRVRHALRLAAKNNERLRAHIRARRPRIKYKAWYERRVESFRRTMPPSTRGDFLRAALARLS
jgi:hypothetical protein